MEEGIPRERMVPVSIGPPAASTEKLSLVR
jgi:hypothetical protein